MPTVEDSPDEEDDSSSEEDSPFGGGAGQMKAAAAGSGATSGVYQVQKLDEGEDDFFKSEWPGAADGTTTPATQQAPIRQPNRYTLKTRGNSRDDTVGAEKITRCDQSVV